jgi:hypothetical protein
MATSIQPWKGLSGKVTDLPRWLAGPVKKVIDAIFGGFTVSADGADLRVTEGGGVHIDFTRGANEDLYPLACRLDGGRLFVAPAQVGTGVPLLNGIPLTTPGHPGFAIGNFAGHIYIRVLYGLDFVQLADGAWIIQEPVLIQAPAVELFTSHPSDIPPTISWSEDGPNLDFPGRHYIHIATLTNGRLQQVTGGNMRLVMLNAYRMHHFYF